MKRRFAGEKFDRLRCGDKPYCAGHKHSASEPRVATFCPRSWLGLIRSALRIFGITRASLKWRVHAWNIEPSSLAPWKVMLLSKLFSNDLQ
jgi:hypothetical protein